MIWVRFFSCVSWNIVDKSIQIRNYLECVFVVRASDKPAQYSSSVLERESLIYCPAARPGNTLPLHWQEAYRLTPPVAQTGGAPYKEVKYFHPDKCVYPPITAYHKPAAPGPCMGCVRTSAKLQKGSVVVWSTSQDLLHLSHSCRMTHLMCLGINTRFIYSPNVLVITFSLLFKAGILSFFMTPLCNLLGSNNIVYVQMGDKTLPCCLSCCSQLITRKKSFHQNLFILFWRLYNMPNSVRGQM